MNRNSISQSAGFTRPAHSRSALAALGILLGAVTVFGQTAEDLRLTVGKSVVIDYPSDIRQISTSSPDIVDASPVTTREILLHGKGLGNATLVVWSKTGERTFYNVTVDLNLDSLRKILKDSFPNEQIVPESSRDSLTLNGKASSKEVADRAIALASTYAKTVVNNLDLGIPPVEKQVLLRVRFAELDRSKAEEYGVNWFSQAGQTSFFASTQQSPISVTPGSAGGQSALSIGSALNLFAFNPKLNLGAFLQALQSENILQILAEPNLVTTNGKEAYFLVGGEFPVPVLQGGGNAGSVTVQFKEFGIRLRFTPVITGNRTIKLHLTQEVSTLDAADGVTFNGFVIPAIATRRAETDVELGEGQSFVVAGLLDNRDTESFSKLPFLGDIPVLGALFKSKTTKKSRTDLVMLVTPEVTEPLGPNDPRPEIAFPKDFLVRLTEADMQNAKSKAGKKN
ncbi:MAG: type II and III secretion system protein family protein [Acidobacteriota bacterium]